MKLKWIKSAIEGGGVLKVERMPEHTHHPVYHAKMEWLDESQKTQLGNAARSIDEALASLDHQLKELCESMNC